MSEEAIEKVYVGSKDISRYISACFFALGKNDKIILVSRGNHIKRALDILAILIRDYLEDPVYNVTVTSDSYENRNVTAIEISLSGKRKEKEEKN